MASSPSQPQQTNNNAAAQATALSNLNFANIATQANRINTTNQSGTVKYKTQENFDQTGYNFALEHWKATGSDPKAMPSKNEFLNKTYTQTEELNPTLQQTLDRQQAANRTIAGAAQTAASKATIAMGNKYTAPNVNDYLKSVPGLDQTKISQIKAPTTLQSG
jgi:hypothetical protein